MRRFRKWRYVNNLLRSSATFLLLLWFFYPWYSLSMHSRVIRSLLNWSDVDYKQPPKTRNFLQESIRLNELLAHIQIYCGKIRNFPDDSDAFPISVCVDLEPVGLSFMAENKRGKKSSKNRQLRIFTITNSLDDFKFEKYAARNFPSSKIWIFVADSEVFRRNWPQILRPPRRNLAEVTAFSGDFVPKSSQVSVNGAVSQGARRYYTADSLFSEVGQIDILKLDCFHCSQPSHLPFLLQELSENAQILLRTNQLILDIRIDAKSDQNFLHRWYLLIHDLFYKTKLALFHAVQFGQCGRRISHCRYRLSFTRIPPGGVFPYLAPSMGMGTPDEEFQRLFQYLSTNALQPEVCGDNFGSVESLVENKFERFLLNWPTIKVWHFCMPQLLQTPNGHVCRIYLFHLPEAPTSYSPVPMKKSRESDAATTEMGVIEDRRDILESFSNELCQIHIFDPDLPTEKLYPERLWFFRKIGLAETNKNQTVPGIKQGTVWNLKPLARIMKDLNHTRVNCILLDLNGGEWDVLENLLSSGVLSERVGQLVIRLRLWYGEEYDIYQRHFSFFLRLNDAGFALFSSTFLETVREHSSIRCGSKECLEVGLVNRKWMEL